MNLFTVGLALFSGYALGGMHGAGIAGVSVLIISFILALR